MQLVWESFENVGGYASGERLSVQRAKVPGGWLITTWLGDSGGVTFLPDPDHEWDGNSLP